MTDAETGHRRLRRGLPTGATLAHKTGTGGVQDGVTSATNDIGIITLPDGRHILIAVYIENSSADAWTRNQVMTDIAKAVCQRWYLGQTTTAQNDKNLRSRI
jgi:beta-lactamase class A